MWIIDWLVSFLPVWMAHGLRRFAAFLTAIAVGISPVAGFYAFPDCINGPLASNAVCDTSKDAVTRATALIDLWTDDELTSNTVNESPGVPRLGIPAYNWWSEALVSYNFLGFGDTFPNAVYASSMDLLNATE